VPVPRDPAFKPYRIAVYCAYGVVCSVLFVQLLRSVMGDLYGRRAEAGAQATPTACLEDVERLYAELSARAVQPAPGGLESNELSREWDTWSRRWEDEVDRVSERCQLSSAADPARRALADALEGIEELRRRLSRSGEDAAEDARSVKESLALARKQLGLK
jgi:hypothetical protein